MYVCVGGGKTPSKLWKRKAEKEDSCWHTPALGGSQSSVVTETQKRVRGRWRVIKVAHIPCEHYVEEYGKLVALSRDLRI